MEISELIKRLEAIKAEFGNIKCYTIHNKEVLEKAQEYLQTACEDEYFIII